MVSIEDKIANRITLSYDKITNEFISIHGKESLLLLSLMSRNLTIRSELLIRLDEIFDNLKVNKVNGKNDIAKCVSNMFNINADKLPTNKTIKLPYKTATSQYLMLYDEEVDYILTNKSRIDKYNLFNTYVAIKRYVNYKTNRSYPSIQQLMHITNVSSNNTIANYINILEDMELIRCYRDDKYIINSSGISRPNNSYEIVKFK